MRLDSVEVKVNLVGDQVEAALSELGLAGSGKDRSIYFCEDVTSQTSPETPLLAAKIIIRARTWSNDKGDTTVKFRPARQSQLAARWAAVGITDNKDLEVEADWAGNNRVLAISYSDDCAATIIEAVHRGKRPVADLLTGDQRDFLQDCSDSRVNLDGLTLLGPVRAVRWASVPAEGPSAGLGIKAERWTLGELDFLELSVDSAPDDATVRQDRLTAFVRSHGLAVDAQQLPKTTLVLGRLVAQQLALVG